MGMQLVNELGIELSPELIKLIELLREKFNKAGLNNMKVCIKKEGDCIFLTDEQEMAVYGLDPYTNTFFAFVSQRIDFDSVEETANHVESQLKYTDMLRSLNEQEQKYFIEDN